MNQQDDENNRSIPTTDPTLLGDPHSRAAGSTIHVETVADDSIGTPSNCVGEDLSKLPISTLIRRLKTRGIDYKDCVEKRDLVERLQSAVEPKKEEHEDFVVQDSAEPKEDPAVVELPFAAMNSAEAEDEGGPTTRLMDKEYMKDLAVKYAKDMSMREEDPIAEGLPIGGAKDSGEEETIASQDTTDDEDPEDPEEQDSYGFATKKFYGFLASSQLHDLTNQSGVMVVGLTRAGKSSAIMVQRGSTLRKEGREFVPVYSNGDPLVSGSSISKTINVGVYDDHQNKRLKYFDTAGLDENRGEAYRSWTHFSLSTARSLLRDLRATLVVINFRSTFEGCGDADQIRKLSELIGISCGGGIHEDYFQNMCFLMTNVQKDDTLFSIIPYVFKLFIGELTQLHTVLKTLESRLGSAGLVTAAKNEASKRLATDTLIGGYLDMRAFQKQTDEVNHWFGKVSRAQRRINAEALMHLNDTDDDRQMWMRVTASTRMLQAILQAGPGRLTLGYPDGPTSCERQRASIDKMIQRCAPIDHSLLVGMSSGGSSSLRAFGILADISRKLTAKAENLCARGEGLLTSLADDSEQQKVTAIEADWQVYKEQRLAHLEKALTDSQKEVQNLNQLILEKKTSTKLVAPPTYIYTINQSASWGEWIFLQRVTYKFTHIGPYEDFSVDEDSAVMRPYTVLQNDGHQLEIKFCGYRSQALTACVRVRRYEKDTAEARSKVEVWESTVKRIKEDITRQQAEIQMLKPCLTREALMAVVLNHSKTLAQLYCKAWEDLQKKVRTTIFHGVDDKEVKVSTWEVCVGLRNLFDHILAKGALDKEMRDSGLKQESMQFCTAMAKVNGLQAKMKANHAARTLMGQKDTVETGDECPGAANAWDQYKGPEVKEKAELEEIPEEIKLDPVSAGAPTPNLPAQERIRRATSEETEFTWQTVRESPDLEKLGSSTNAPTPNITPEVATSGLQSPSGVAPSTNIGQAIERTAESASGSSIGSSAQVSSAPTPNITPELSAWLEAKSLSHVASALVKEVGVHSLEEVEMIVKEPECQGMLEKLPPMYAYKLKKAVLDGGW